MRCARVLLSVLLAFSFLSPLLSAPIGSFRGVIVRGNGDNPGWIWVKGANGRLRKVGVSRARVVYDNAVPVVDRERQPELSMKPGAEIRITASQDRDGEWLASRIEILQVRSSEPAVPPPSRRNLDKVISTL